MINASKEFKEKLKNGANVVNYADFTLSDGTALKLEPKDFMIGGCQIEDKTTDGKFGVGFAIGKTLTLRIANHNEQFSKYDFYGSTINLYVALLLDDGTIEKIRKGIYYTLVPETPGDIIEISAVDSMYKLDKDYSASATIYPSTLQRIITDVCIDCGIPVGFTQFDNMSFVVQSGPENTTTYRQVLSWACQIAGYNARIDNDGYMRLVWYDTSLLDAYSYTGGNFKQYPHDTVVDGGNFKNYSANTIISGGSFTDEMPQHIFRTKSINVHTDDVQITGVKVVGEDETGALFGEEGYLIELTENPFVSGKEREVASYLGARMVGMVFRPFSADILNNPLYEPFDVVRASDAKGNVYLSLLNSVSYKIGGYTTVACEAEDPIRNGSTYVSASAQAVVEARRNTEKQISTYDKAVQGMNELAANAMGLFRENELQDNGSYIYYESDRPITVDENGKCHFEPGSHVWKKSDAGFFASEDGGKTYTAGFDKNNNAVLNVLYAIGIVADWIKTGRIEIAKEGKTMVLMDFDTGQVILRPDVFELSSGKTINSIAKEEASSAVDDFIDAVYDPKIASLQAQIDGQIETWYYDYQPTLNNIPASNWKTEADRVKHEGDLFYWMSKGYSYRFFKDGNTWKWQLITDSDITKALSDASKAQDTADNKRRVFVTTPKPPYDVGDLWFAGSSSDIMTCMTARASGNYTASDWQKRNKYIDQTAADSAASNAVKNQTQTDILNKLTNNGADKGIYLLNGKLYISFNAARGGALTLGGADNVNGTLVILDRLGRQIGKWDKDGIDALNGSFSGTIISSSGTVGGFSIGNHGLKLGSLFADSELNVEGSESLYIGETGIKIRNSETRNLISFKDGMVYLYDTTPMLQGGIGCGGGSYGDTGFGIYQPVNGSEPSRWKRVLGTGTSTSRYVNIYGNFTVSSSYTKSKEADTENYGHRLLYCYEMPSPMFGDIGEGETDENGECYVDIGDIFSETISENMEYQVFLQKEGSGDIWVDSKEASFFVVKGTKNLKFTWEIKAKQKGFEYERLEIFDDEPQEDPWIPYESEYMDEIEQLLKEKEDVLYETA